MTLTCHVTEEEHILICERMRKVGERKISAFVRTMLLAGQLTELDHSELKVQSVILQIINKRIESILSKVDIEGVVKEREIEEIRLAIAEIWRLEKMNLSKYCVLN